MQTASNRLLLLGPGADLGGGNRRTEAPSLGIRPPADPNGPPFFTILRYPVLVTDFQFSLIFQKVPKKRFLASFFKILPAAQKCWPVFENSRRNSFWKSAPTPLEKVGWIQSKSTWSARSKILRNGSKQTKWPLTMKNQMLTWNLETTLQNHYLAEINTASSGTPTIKSSNLTWTEN